MKLKKLFCIFISSKQPATVCTLKIQIHPKIGLKQGVKNSKQFLKYL